MGKKALDLRVQRVKIINAAEANAEIYVLGYCIDDSIGTVEDLLDPRLLTGKIEENINDGDEMTLGPGGILCYSKHDDDVPKFLSWAITVYESDHGVRDFGAALEQVGGDKRFQTMASVAAGLLSGGTAAALAGIAGEILGIVGSVLQLDRDDQLFMVQDCYDAYLDSTGPKTIRNVVKSNENVKLVYKLRHLDKP
jgi:hypothetical protein